MTSPTFITRPGIAWMLTAALCFSCMAVFVKLASATASVSQTVFFRSLVSLPILLFWATRSHIRILGTNHKLLVLRGFLGFLSLSLYFFGLSRLHIGNAAILNATAPVFVVLLSGRLLGEAAPKKVRFLLPILLVGVGLIAKPKFGGDLIPSLATLLSGFLAALAYLSVRHLGRTESSTTIIFYFSIIAFVGSFPMALLNWAPLSAQSTLYLVASGIFATLAQYAMTEAYRLEKAGLVSLFSYAGPVFSFLLGMLLLGELPDPFSILGAGIILLTGISASRLQRGR